MFESTSASSLLLNIEPNVDETSGDVMRPHSPPIPIESHFNQHSQQAYSTASNINSRPTTPGSRSLRKCQLYMAIRWKHLVIRKTHK